MWVKGKPLKADQRLWNMIRGQIVDAFRQHPNYLAETMSGRDKRTAIDSIAKRAFTGK